MALKFIQTCSKLLDAYKFTGILINQFSGKVQVKLYQKKPTTKDEIVNYKENKASIIEALETLLNIRKLTAVSLVIQQIKLTQIHANILTQNHKVLQGHGVKNATMIKYPELLAMQMPKDLEENIAQVKKLPYDIDAAIYLVCLEKEQLARLLRKADFLPKVDLLVRKLETTVDVVMESFVKRPFLAKASLGRMEEVIDVLKENKILPAEIIKDWWILQYTPHIIGDRIEFAKQHNIDAIKTWMVRCTEDILQRYIQRQSENKLVLGDCTQVGYLSQRLQCSSEAAKALVMKLPALQNKSMKKMKEVIDFLYAEGFKPHHISRVPKILLHSVQTTQKRIRELEKQGVQMDSLHMLTKSQRQYMQYYQALVKSNANKVKQTKQSESEDAPVDCETNK